MDHRKRLTRATPPNHMVSGWFDFMIDQLLADYQRLVDAGQRPYLTVSNSTHVSGGNEADHPAETLHWMRAHLLGEKDGLREKPVRFEIIGDGRWVECESFPPPGGEEKVLYLHPDRSLVDRAPSEPAEPVTYRYDPEDPTPNIGGAIFAFFGAGAADNAPREQRPDVLCFTSPVRAEPFTIIGNGRVVLYARSDNPHLDFFVRLCDVDPRGRSSNICDGLVRMTPDSPKRPDSTWQVELRLHATAYTVLAGHSLRLQVSSGAHPRYARNSGTSVPIGQALQFKPANVEIFHDNEHPSHLVLPTYEADRL
jgi:hypothetical protein